MTTGTPVAASHLPIASDPDNLLEHLDHLVFEPLARLITAMAHESITDKPNRATSLSASWFLHPKQHAVELVLMNVIIGLMLYNYVGVAWRENYSHMAVFIKRREQVFRKHFKEPTKRALRVAETCVIGALTVSYALMWNYKIRKGTHWFMLQPCHMDVLLYSLLMMFGKSNSIAANFMFNLLVQHSWGTIMALLQPDLRDYNQFLEVPMFWIEHLIILVAPIFCIATHRFQLLPRGWSMTMTAFLALAAYHFLVLAPIAIACGRNLNYLMSPPIGVLEQFGKMYRPAMVVLCVLATIVTRYGLLYGLESLLDRVRTPLASLPVSGKDNMRSKRSGSSGSTRSRRSRGESANVGRTVVM